MPFDTRPTETLYSQPLFAPETRVRRRHLARALKRGFDLAVGAALIVPVGGLVAGLALLIRVMDGQDAIFWHERIGRDGRRFRCFKLRTMVKAADVKLAEILASDPRAAEEWRLTHKLVDDPRITPLGRFLRRTSLDELPQLWNVLRGDMSLVGPRPIVEEERARYGDDFIYYLAVTPGITGLWQVSGRNQVSYEERVQLDRCYAETWSFWLDLRILVRTVSVVLSRRGAH